MADSVEQIFNGLALPFYFGEILVARSEDGSFVLSHRKDEPPAQLHRHRGANDAIEIAKYDDNGNYRPLKTAPNLRRGWRLELVTPEELQRALDYFYPGRLAVFAAWKSGFLKTTPLRETLNRQSGMYRVAAKISEPQVNDVVADFCRSDSGCVRTILWKRDRNGTIASTKLPDEKFDPAFDQARVSHPSSRHSDVAGSEGATIPLLCQEACNLLVADCRKVAKAEKTTL